MKRPAAVSDSDSDGDQASKRARTEEPSDDETPRGTRRRRPQGRANGRLTQRDNADEIEELSEGESEIGVSAPVNDDDDDDDDEKFEKRHGDTLRKQLNNKKSTKKRVADYGVIEAIEMHQFMCHKKLSFEFGPQINFIIGHNGSGKSAVLSALTIALGGKTNSTGRGSGLKSFIREGQNGSEVTIKLKNQGSEGFKHDQYGDSIIITRRFTKEGTSTWKIQDKNGKLVSNKREELSAICDHMNIQVDNPMNVLTQDSARQFLSASAPTDKYKFFLLGTQLFQLSNEYDTCLQNISKTYKILGLKHSAIPDLRDKYREALAKFEEAKKAREQRKKSDDLKKELAWSHVAAKRMEMEKKVDEVVKLKRRVPKIEEGLAEAEAAVSECEASIEALENEVAELGDQTQLTAERTKITTEIKANSKKLSALNADMNTINRTLKSVNTQIEGLDKQIATEEARMAKHSQDRREQLDHRINGAKSIIEAAEQRYKDVLRQKQSLKEQLAVIAQEGDKLDKDLDGVKQEITQCQFNIDEARRSVNDAYAPYGINIQAVCAKLRTMQWHGEVPLGPLGMHVKAKDPATWGDLLRAQLGSLLCSFALTDARDRPQMKRLLDQYRNRNTIIIYERDLFNFSRGEPDPRYLTVLRALDISDEYVTRILVNQSRIENVILARTRRELQGQLEELRGGVGWSHDRFTVRVFPDGGCTSTPLPKGGGHNLLLTGRDSASEIGHHEQEKRRLEQSHEAITGEIAKRKQAFSEMKKANERLSEPEAQAVREIRAAKHELTTLQQEADEDLPTTIAGFKSARDEAVKEKELHMAQFEEVCKSKADIDSANYALQRESDLLKAQLDDFTVRKTALTEQIVNASVNRVQNQADVKNLKDRLNKQKEVIAVEEEVASTLEQEFKNWTNSALGFCPEVPNPRSLAQVQRELDSVNHALRERERRHGATVEDMAAEVTKTRAAFDKVHGEYKQMAELNKALKTSLSLRLHRWQEFRRHIALRTKFIFQLHMSQRGYFGKLMFNHTAQTLNIRVQTDDQAAAEGNAEKDPRSLSGGEKSFSTICLLLSLWDSIGCPLRCLDEFDVFMDAVNRRISMKMMIATANDSPDKQYILITPQDMTNIRIEDNVKVHRMNDPERNTGRLRFGAGPSNE